MVSNKRVREVENDPPQEQRKRNKHDGDGSYNNRKEPTPVIDLDATDLVNEDDDDIPYTHSRSQSPVFLSSELDSAIEEAVTHATTRGHDNNTPDDAEVLDVDDILSEYYVISDEEEDDDDTVKGTEGQADAPLGSQQKSTSEQLEENQKPCNSNLNRTHCAVCFESPETTYILPCGHIYCGDCVFKAISSTRQSTKNGGPCSLCRKYASYKSVTLAIFKKKKKKLTG